MRTTRRAFRAVARPARRVPPALLLDILICLATLVLFIVGWSTLHVTHTLAAPLQPVMAAAAVGPLVLLRANPALGWAISASAALVMGTLVGNQPGNDIPWQVVNIIALIVLVFGVALRMALPVIGVVWASTVLLFVAYMPSGARLVWPVVFAAVVAFALLIRWLALSRRQLARQEEVSELERARRAILEEKAQIARDLHDVVAHHMSLVVVQAQSAPYRLTSVTDEVRAEFDSIGATAREALNEIRGLLGVLRSDGVGPEHNPQPRAADLAELLESTRRAGVEVTWKIDDGTAEVGEVTGMVKYTDLRDGSPLVGEGSATLATAFEAHGITW
ncbi:MAG TPA: histidine kinase, partial [Aldersonia sp.]